MFIILILSAGGPVYALDANFQINQVSQCTPSGVVITNQSTQGLGIKFEWDFGKGGGIVVTNDVDLEQVYNDAGDFTITLYAIEGTDTIKSSKAIHVANGPTANFTYDAASGCTPLTVHYTNTSTAGDAPISSISWDLGDGKLYNGLNAVEKIYTRESKYNALILVKDTNGCEDYLEKQKIIDAYDGVDVNFYASETNACNAPLFVNFVNLSSVQLGLGYEWDFGNGIKSSARDTAIFYTQDGTYDVKLSVKDNEGCNSVLFKENLINVGHEIKQINAFQSGRTIDGNELVLCREPVYFKASGAKNDSHRWEVEYGGKFRSKIGDTIMVLDNPADSIVVTLYYGVGEICPDTAVRVFYMDNFKVDIERDPQTSCKFPVPVNYKGVPNEAVDYYWVFNDGTISETLDTTIVFAEPESYKQYYSHEVPGYELMAVFIGTDEYGCTVSDTDKFVPQLPLARFMPNRISGCVPLDVTIYDLSVSNEEITNWKYLIEGQEILRTDSLPFTHTFNTPGRYDIIEMIQNIKGCADTSFAITIYAGDVVHPDISLSDTKLCIGDSLQITGSAELMDSLGFWHFSSDNVFNYTYLPSVVRVKAMADHLGPHDIYVQTSYNGCPSDSLFENAYYVSGPSGNIYKEFSCDSSYNYLFTTDVEQATYFRWEIDDTIFENTDSVYYNFNKSGNYDIIFTAENDTAGCLLVKHDSVPVRNVVSVIDVDTIVCSLQVAMKSENSVDYTNYCYREGFLWYFGDGQRPDREFMTEHQHVYGMPGDYWISLVTRGDNGCTDSTSQKIKVLYHQPDFTMDKDTGCVPSATVNFTKTTVDTNEIYWQWIWGDDTESLPGQNFNPSHTYTSSTQGSFYPKLEVKDSYGCTWDTIKEFVLEGIDPYFYADNLKLCENQSTTFSFADEKVTGHNINFGDGTSSTTSLTHTYANVGKYDVSVTVNSSLCNSSYVREDYIEVIEADATYAVSDSVFDCYPVIVSFNHLNNGDVPISDGLWDFGDEGGMAAYNKNVVYTYSKRGTYHTSLRIQTFNNCNASYEQTITITGPDADIDILPRNLCYGEEADFSVTNLIDTEEYTWVFGDGQTSTELNPSHAYTVRGGITPLLRLKNGDCEVVKDAGSVYVSLYEGGFNVNSANNNYCETDNLILTNTANDIASASWVLNGEVVSDQINPAPVALNETGKILIRQVSKGADNCTDTVEAEIEVFEVPAFTISGDNVVCPGGSTTLAVEQQPGWSITWQPEEGISDPFSFSPVFSPDSTMFYSATVFGDNNCNTTRIVNIRVPYEFEFTKFPLSDTIINLGESILLSVFTDSEGVTYEWDPDYRLSCNNCSNPLADPYKNTTYIVTMKGECNTGTASFYVEVYDEFYIEAPTAFTPNGDGKNEEFKLETFNISEIIEFKIYNRWGNKVFSTNSMDEGWDGAVNGKSQPADTYAWFARARNIFGFEVERQGSVILLK